MKTLATLVTTVALAGLLTTSAPAQAATPATYSAPLRTAVAGLPVAAEVRTGYDRALFPHWIDADRDGCDTREETLIAEARTRPRQGRGCALSGGRWYSPYDNRWWTRTSDLDVDHVVALAEAWDSGARRWSSAQRRAFANDLGDARSLAAVTDNVNAAKGDRDPAQWLPPYTRYRCAYVAHWVAVKVRWRLTVDPAEKSRLRALAGSCPNVRVTVRRAL